MPFTRATGGCQLLTARRLPLDCFANFYRTDSAATALRASPMQGRDLFSFLTHPRRPLSDVIFFSNTFRGFASVLRRKLAYRLATLNFETKIVDRGHVIAPSSGLTVILQTIFLEICYCLVRSLRSQARFVSVNPTCTCSFLNFLVLFSSDFLA